MGEQEIQLTTIYDTIFAFAGLPLPKLKLSPTRTEMPMIGLRN
jgi:hypothetical protein